MRHRIGLPAQLPGMGVSMIGPIIYGYGTAEQQERLLPDILADRVHWCQGYSEPGSGSDLASLRTRAERVGDEYVVTGEKIWTSGAHRADMMFCLTRTRHFRPEEGKPQAGISFLLLDMRDPGVEVTPIISIDGHHSLNRVTLDAVRVPVSMRIGEEHQGWTYAKGLLTHERTGLAFVGESLRKLATLRREGAARIDPALVMRIDALETELRALEITELRTLAETAEGAAPGEQSSILKLKGTDIVQRMTELLVETMGYAGMPYPLVDGDPPRPGIGPEYAQLEMAQYLLARSASIAGGSDEIQRNIIAKHVLGL